MRLYLIVAKGKHQGMPILVKVDLFLMGSEKLCQLRSGLPGIAPQHCAVVTRGHRAFVRDLGGGRTLVNNEPVTAHSEWPLHKGDRLAVGPLEFLVEFHEKQLEHRDAESWARRSLDLQAQRDAQEEEEETVGLYAEGAPDTAAAAAAAILGRLQLQKGIVHGRLRIAAQGDVTIVRFDDRQMVEEAEVAYIKKELLDNLKRPGQRILLDFKHVRRMSSAAVEMIQDVCRRIRDHAGSVAFCRVRSEIRSVMNTLGAFQTTRYFNDKESALAASW